MVISVKLPCGESQAFNIYVVFFFLYICFKTNHVQIHVSSGSTCRVAYFLL